MPAATVVNYSLQFNVVGVDVLNGSIDSLHSSVPPENWTYVSVTIAPSTITIADHEVSVMLCFWFPLVLQR